MLRMIALVSSLLILLLKCEVFYRQRPYDKGNWYSAKIGRGNFVPHLPHHPPLSARIRRLLDVADISDLIYLSPDSANNLRYQLMPVRSVDASREASFLS